MMVLVTGPQSSGTRLVAHLLLDGGVDVWHDKSHGTKPVAADRVVAVVRDAWCTLQSQKQSFPIVSDRVPRSESLIGIADHHPDALWISYEQMCGDPDGTIRVIADWLGVQPWPLQREVIDQNAKWRSGVGGPQIPEDVPV